MMKKIQALLQKKNELEHVQTIALCKVVNCLNHFAAVLHNQWLIHQGHHSYDQFIESDKRARQPDSFMLH